MKIDRSVKVKEIVNKFEMEVICEGAEYETEVITITDVNRPGLQLTGYFDYFDFKRMQLLGMSETSYLGGLSSEERTKRFAALFEYDIPALVVTRELDVFPECIEMAQKYGRTLLRTHLSSIEFTSGVVEYLNHELAPMIARHGVLMDVADYIEGKRSYMDITLEIRNRSVRKQCD